MNRPSFYRQAMKSRALNSVSKPSGSIDDRTGSGRHRERGYTREKWTLLKETMERHPEANTAMLAELTGFSLNQVREYRKALREEGQI